MGSAAINPEALLRAENADLRARLTSLARLLEHQRMVLAVALKRLGGVLIITDEALAHALQGYEVEVGQSQGFAQLSEDPTVPPAAPAPRLSFRLVVKGTNEPLVPKLKNLPQDIRDILEAVATGNGGAERARELAVAVRARIVDDTSGGA